MKGGLTFLILGFAFASISFAQAGASDPDLSGTWVDKSNSALKYVFNEKGDKIQVQESDGDRMIANYSCNLSGSECAVKEDGKPVKVMIYYNGAKLIEIRERGNDVEKRRFSLGADGKTLVMEIIPLSSGGKTSTRTFQKQAEQQSQVANSGV